MQKNAGENWYIINQETKWKQNLSIRKIVKLKKKESAKRKNLLDPTVWKWLQIKGKFAYTDVYFTSRDSCAMHAHARSSKNRQH